MHKFIYHYLVPHKGNNHRSKILHNSSLLVIVILLLFSSWFSIIVNKTSPHILGISYSISDQELLILVNEQRINNGREPLKMNDRLSKAAQGKANHMLTNNYWAHFAPDDTTPWKFIVDSGYNYIYAGENLAKGFVNAQDAVTAWMNSSTHRDNILSDQYKDVGFAIVEGNLQGEDTVLIVEMFGQEKNQFLAAATADVSSIVDTPEPEELSEASPSVNQTAEAPLLLGAANIETLNTGTKPQEKLYQSKPLLDLFISAKSFSFIIIAVLLIAFILDLIIVSRKKIPRIVGNNLDHILLLSIFVVFIFIYNLGIVL